MSAAPANDALAPVRVDDWTLYVADEQHLVRDLDLADRACLASPRDIRRTIKTAIEDKLVTVFGGVGAAHATKTPVVYAQKVLVPNGDHGGTQEVTEFYLDQEAALLILTRLRTPAAIEVTKAVVKVFLAVVRGELRPSAPVPILGGEWGESAITLRKAALLNTLADAMSPAVSAEAKDTLRAHAATMLTGGTVTALLPALPAGRWRRPTEMAAEFGVSVQKLGKAITALGFRGQEQHRRGVMDQKAHGEGQVECSLWDETVYLALRKHFGLTASAEVA